VDQFDESGNRVNREIRRERRNADNGRILDTGGDKFSSSSSAGKQTGAVIEKKVVVRKMEKSQKIGLKLETLHTANSKSLFVAGIHPSGLLAKNQASLVLGDIILKINSFDFGENPILEIANSIISNSVGDIAIIASGAAQSLTDFSRNKVEDEETKVTAVEFDENSYGGSISSYMSSKVLRLSKADPLECVGFGMMAQITKWGPMLVVSEISGKVEQTALEVGDAILAINGINFRGKPDPDRAASVLKKATKVVVIEYQRLSQMKSSLSFSGSAAMEKERSRSKSAGESRRSKRIEEYDASFRTRVTPSKSVKGSVITPEKNSSPARLPQSKRSTEPDHQLVPKFIPPKSDTFVVRVAKEYPEQEFGISVESVHGILFVSEISLPGLLVGENVLPGDIILSINNMSFHENASVQEAEAQITDARVLILEVKKQNGAPTSDPHQLKLKWHERLQCKKRSVESL
jgi:C-terminal processing protease CtpA/Prc